MRTLPELHVNRNTPGRIVIERDETAYVPHCSSWGPWEIVVNQDKTWSYPKAAATKRELNVADRNTTSSDRKSPADALASRFATDTV